MENALFWQTVLYSMLCFTMAGYTLLDGFDLGAGMLLAFFRKQDEQRLLLNALAPVWDGNEVWLIIAGGLLLAAFPPVYAAALTGFYTLVMAVLFALILRAAAFEFWYRDEKRRVVWGVVFCASSLFIPLILGLLVGNAIAGVPLTPDFKYMGTWAALFKPLPISMALAGTSSFFFQGAAYLVRKTEAGLQTRLLALAQKGWWVMAATCLGFGLLAAYTLPGSRGHALFWLGGGVAVLGLGLSAASVFRGLTRPLFVQSSLGLVGLWLLISGVQFPNLIRGCAPMGASLTVANAASPVLVLKLLAGLVGVGMLLVLGTTWFVYRVFKGKTLPEEGY